jgi:von Willebrand factor type A domain
VRTGRSWVGRVARRWGLGTAGLLLAAAVATPAAAVDTAPDAEQVLRELGADAVSADYVVLVDTSGSMADDGLYDQVSKTLGSFLQGLSSSDYLAIYTFDEVAIPRYLGQAGSTAAAMAHLPPAPTVNGSTDIGAAIEAALTELERPDAANVASVVLLTDGAHSPPSGSQYPSSSGPEWAALKDRADRLRKSWLGAYALPLTGGASGAGLLRRVIPTTTVLDPDSVSQLGPYLERSKHQARLAKAAAMLAPDVGKGVAVEWHGQQPLDFDAGTARLAVTLRSQTSLVPLEVTGLSAAVAGAPEASAKLAGAPGTVSLAPGEAVSYDLILRWNPDADPLPVRRTKHLDGSLTVVGRVDSPWSAALGADVPLRVPAVPAQATRPLVGEAAVGWWGTLPLTVAVVALLAAIGTWAWYAHSRPRIEGWLSTRSVPADTELAVIGLGARSVPIHSPRLSGDGVVRGRRTPRGVALLISYSPDGSAARRITRSCPPGESVIVGGVAFHHHQLELPTADLGLPASGLDTSGRPEGAR